MKFVYEYQGRTITLVGTAHVSPDSVKEVENEALKSNITDICIELDRQRYNSMMESKKEELIIESKIKNLNNNKNENKKNNKNENKIRKQIKKQMNKRKKKKTNYNKEFGVFGNLFLKIGSFIQNKIGDILNIEPGSEFIRSIEIAKERDINLFLVDQKINQTLSDFKKIPKKEQWKILKSILWPFGMDNSNLRNIDKKNINMKNMIFDYKTILNITEFMRKNFPTFYFVLVEKRNVIMIENIMKIFKEKSNGDILCVVGAGHLPGMLKIIDKDENFRRII
ncbi:MAG: TraB/GumN family protein [Candidatus Nanoarchaeia archaeon]|nr:TraB/GumN family protein [Candidatus Nanoarchaeia archaeon]